MGSPILLFPLVKDVWFIEGPGEWATFIFEEPSCMGLGSLRLMGYHLY